MRRMPNQKPNQKPDQPLDRKSTRSFLGCLAGGLIASVIIAACAGPRPIDSVREDGDFHFKRTAWSEAAAYYEEIADRYPGDWRANHRLGICLTEMGQYNAARRVLKKAADLRPGNPDIADARAEAMFREGDHQQLAVFLRNEAREQQDVRSWLRVADYSLRMQDPDSAELAIETAIEVDDGRSPAPYIAAADLAEQVGDLETAVRRLRQAWSIERSEAVATRLRRLGEIPGPTGGLPPGR